MGDKKKTLKVVYVQWVDPAFAHNEWKQWTEFNAWLKKGIAQSDSVGILVHEDESMIVLVQSIGETQLAGGLKINKASIKSIKTLGHVPITLKPFG